MEYGILPEADSLPNSKKHTAPDHINTDRLVIFLLEGKELLPEMHEHLVKCRPCRHEMVDVVRKTLRRHRSKLCETHNSLCREWRNAAVMYANTLADLLEKGGRVLPSQRSKLATTTETVRRLTEQTRTELDKHIAEHRC